MLVVSHICSWRRCQTFNEKAIRVSDDQVVKENAERTAFAPAQRLSEVLVLWHRRRPSADDELRSCFRRGRLGCAGESGRDDRTCVGKRPD